MPFRYEQVGGDSIGFEQASFVCSSVILSISGAGICQLALCQLYKHPGTQIAIMLQVLPPCRVRHHGASTCAACLHGSSGIDGAIGTQCMGS